MHFEFLQYERNRSVCWLYLCLKRACNINSALLRQDKNESILWWNLSLSALQTVWMPSLYLCDESIFWGKVNILVAWALAVLVLLRFISLALLFFVWLSTVERIHLNWWIFERRDEWCKRFLFLCACYGEHVRTQKQFMFIDGRTRFYHSVHPPCNHFECMRKMKWIKFPLFLFLLST